MSGLSVKYFTARFFKNGRLQTCIDFSQFEFAVKLSNYFIDFRESKVHRAGRVEIAAVQGKDEIVICEFKTDELEKVEATLFKLKTDVLKNIPKLGE